ncbi:hypothetical protein LU293_02030 [Moraxella nasovis]|uniref:hypothetical protein n=1 Tax=Moraxella nasovis TaxID=2904121 RepID=UPI001F611EC3|nr:hypothetical protein [Moraxella nasovis]UNU73712.1 hypothetical protein LU293_02030 [Moraxella nasovis]
MLKVIDDGVEIALHGKQSNSLFWVSIVLVVLALIVAVVAMTQKVQITIGMMAVFAVVIFIFNTIKAKAKSRLSITSGHLVLKNQSFCCGHHAVQLSPTAQIIVANDTLIIKDKDKTWQISGFEHEKELMVAQSVLMGKDIAKQQKTIKMQG